VTADLSGTAVATVVAQVTGPDIPTALVFNIPIADRVASGPIDVPAGSGRILTIQAFDAGGVETHSGTATINVQPGANPTVAIVLAPLVGTVPINATLGSFTVTVLPLQVTLSIGATAPLTASIKDWNGNPPSGTVTVSWATHDPGVASVDQSGLVKGTGAGTTTISATYQGATGVATASVGP